MAQIEVTEILCDPDFVDKIVLINRRPAINNLGENTLTELSINSIGCVQPISGRNILRIPEALRVANMSSFWFKGTITASAPGKYSSLLVFKGFRFEVQHVYDWSNYGPGYTEGVCVAEVPA